MPVITKIIEQKRRANRRSVYLDGTFAFGCNVNVVAKFRLREGITIDAEQLAAIQNGEVRQECFDSATRFISMRLHSVAELRRKLMRKEFGPGIVDIVIEDLKRMNYLDDAKFAKAKTTSVAKHKHHGKNRARIELMKAGVERGTAHHALEEVYEATDSLSIARDLARKKMRSLVKLEKHVAKRRLMGMLLRRGFEFEHIRPVIEEVLGEVDEFGGE